MVERALNVPSHARKDAIDRGWHFAFDLQIDHIGFDTARRVQPVQCGASANNMFAVLSFAR